MNKIIFFFTLALGLPWDVTSQTYNYAINTLNIPCLTQKGDAALGIGWGRGSAFQALEIQGVYSPVSHWAVMANYFGAREKNVRKELENGTDFYLWEVGVGAYEQIPKGSASLFAGFGSGTLFNHYTANRNAEFNIQRWFLQPGLNYRSKLFQAGLALRLSRLAYNSGTVSYSIERPDIDYIQNIEKNAPLFLPELGIQAGMRIKPVLVNLSISSIFPNTDHWNFNRLNTSLSIIVGFGVGRDNKKS